MAHGTRKHVGWDADDEDDDGDLMDGGPEDEPEEDPWEEADDTGEWEVYDAESDSWVPEDELDDDDGEDIY